MAVNKIDVLADRGYFNGEILACEAISATPYVPRPLTSNAKAAGRFGKDDFIYLPDQRPTAVQLEKFSAIVSQVSRMGERSTAIGQQSAMPAR